MNAEAGRAKAKKGRGKRRVKKTRGLSSQRGCGPGACSQGAQSAHSAAPTTPRSQRRARAQTDCVHGAAVTVKGRATRAKLERIADVIAHVGATRGAARRGAAREVTSRVSKEGRMRRGRSLE